MQSHTSKLIKSNHVMEDSKEMERSVLRVGTVGQGEAIHPGHTLSFSHVEGIPLPPQQRIPLPPQQHIPALCDPTAA